MKRPPTAGRRRLAAVMRANDVAMAPKPPGCPPVGASRRRGLIRDHGAEAYSKARQREHDASSDAMVKHWRRVVLAIAKKTGKRVGVDTPTRMLGRDDTD
jgi:hypothetical protein